MAGTWKSHGTRTVQAKVPNTTAGSYYRSIVHTMNRIGQDCQSLSRAIGEGKPYSVFGSALRQGVGYTA